MTTPTVPQDVYKRHEREWEMLREALAKSQSDSIETGQAETISDPYRWPPVQIRQ